MKSVNLVRKLTPGKIFLGLFLFVYGVSLACTTPESSNQLDTTMAALNLQSTELALKATQLAQDASQQRLDLGGHGAEFCPSAI